MTTPIVVYYYIKDPLKTYFNEIIPNTKCCSSPYKSYLSID